MNTAQRTFWPIQVDGKERSVRWCIAETQFHISRQATLVSVQELYVHHMAADE